MKYVILAILIFIFIYLFMQNDIESMDNKEMRARDIYEWFQDNVNPLFTKFRDETAGDIVEYESIMNLRSKQKNLTVEDIYAVI